MNKSIVILVSLVTILSLSACKKDRLNANGNIISENRSVANFTGVSANGDTDVYVSYGPEFSVVVRGSSNLVPHFKTQVVNNVLHLKFENVNVSDDDIDVMVTMPTVNKVAISGSGDVEIKGSFPAVSNLEASVTGSGDIEVENNITIDRLNVDISGSGEVDFERVTAKIANVNLTGSGEIKFQVSETLKARITGSGKIYYRGNPTVQQDISGSGKLIKY